MAKVEPTKERTDSAEETGVVRCSACGKGIEKPEDVVLTGGDAMHVGCYADGHRLPKD